MLFWLVTVKEPLISTFPFMETSANVVFPVKVGEAKFAFKSNAVEVAVDTGLSVSAVLSTLPRPTIDFVIPSTVPVNVAPDKLAFPSNAVEVAVDTGLSISAVLSTLPRPTIDFVIPPTVPDTLKFPFNEISSVTIDVYSLTVVLITVMLFWLVTVKVPLISTFPFMETSANVVFPVKVGEAKFAFKLRETSVYDLLVAMFDVFVAMSVVFVPKLVETSPINSVISPMCVCTNAVVANCVLLVVLLAVVAEGVPVKVGEAKFAFKLRETSVYDLLVAMFDVFVAMSVVFVPKLVETSPINSVISPMCVCTNAVVANCVLLVVLLAVVAEGVPVKVGEAKFAFKFKLPETSPIRVCTKAVVASFPEFSVVGSVEVAINDDALILPVVMLLLVKSPSIVTLSDISTVSEMCTDPLTSSVLFGFRVPIPNCWKLMLRYITYIYIILYF